MSVLTLKQWDGPQEMKQYKLLECMKMRRNENENGDIPRDLWEHMLKTWLERGPPNRTSVCVCRIQGLKDNRMYVAKFVALEPDYVAHAREIMIHYKLYVEENSKSVCPLDAVACIPPTSLTKSVNGWGILVMDHMPLDLEFVLNWYERQLNKNKKDRACLPFMVHLSREMINLLTEFEAKHLRHGDWKPQNVLLQCTTQEGKEVNERRMVQTALCHQLSQSYKEGGKNNEQLCSKLMAIDFGLSEWYETGFEQPTYHMAGTPTYLAPEIRSSGRRLTMGGQFNADLYSVALILARLFFPKLATRLYFDEIKTLRKAMEIRGRLAENLREVLMDPHYMASYFKNENLLDHHRILFVAAQCIAEMLSPYAPQHRRLGYHFFREEVLQMPPLKESPTAEMREVVKNGMVYTITENDHTNNTIPTAAPTAPQLQFLPKKMTELDTYVKQFEWAEQLSDRVMRGEDEVAEDAPVTPGRGDVPGSARFLRNVECPENNCVMESVSSGARAGTCFKLLDEDREFDICSVM